MRRVLFSVYSGPLVGLGALVAVACLAGSWYINRLQAELARTVRQDVSAMEAAINLQVQLRHLRVHSLVFAADNTDIRWELVRADLARVDTALKAVQHTATASGDAQLAERIEHDYARYRDNLGLDALAPGAKPVSDVAGWSD